MNFHASAADYHSQLTVRFQHHHHFSPQWSMCAITWICYCILLLYYENCEK